MTSCTAEIHPTSDREARFALADHLEHSCPLWLAATAYLSEGDGDDD